MQSIDAACAPARACLIGMLGLITLAGALHAAPGMAAASGASLDLQAPARVTTLGLREAYAAAWERQPEAKSAAVREESARARGDITRSWTAEPVAVELATKTDLLNGNHGAREYELGVAIPLWLPGERAGLRSVVEAETRSIGTRVGAAKLRTSAAVRDAYWSWQRARIDWVLAGDRLANARALAADVARRVRAGDLSRADQHQAQGSVAAAAGGVAESRRALAAARQSLRAVTGLVPPEPAETTAAAEPDGAEGVQTEAVPALPASFAGLDASHPAVLDLVAQAEVARRAIDLARTRKRANPELLLATTRDRGAFAHPYQQTITVGVRIPLGSDARQRARIASASAEAIELESQLELERSRVLAGLDAAREQVDATRAQLDAARERARLARETRGFFEKSFRAGETDLPTRLRVELEATESARQAARAHIDHASAVSALRQALGLLPE